MKKIIFLTLILLNLLINCKTEENIRSNEKTITSLIINNGNNNLEGIIEGTNIIFNEKVDFGTTKVTIQNIQLSPNAKSTKNKGDTLNISDPSIVIIAENSSLQTYNLTINVVPPSPEKDILNITINDGTNSFNGTISGTFISFDKVRLDVKKVTINALTISPNATTNKVVNDSIPVGTSTIIVTAQDNSIKEYELTIVSKTKATLTNLIVSNVNINSIEVDVVHLAGNTPTTNYGFIYSNTISGENLVTEQNGIQSFNLTSPITNNSFNGILRNLIPEATYYIKAFATNGAATAYSDEIIAAIQLPTNSIRLENINIREIATTQATFATSFTIGNSNVIKYGILYSETISGEGLTINEISNNNINIFIKADSPSRDTLIVEETNFTPNTHYFVRAFATDLLGTQYSNNTIDFTTNALRLATLTNANFSTATTNAIDITVNYTTGNNNTINYGFVYSDNISGNDLTIAREGALIKTFIGAPTENSFSATLDNLNHSTPYYVKAFANNAAGTSYSEEITAATLIITKPTLGSISANNITTNSINMTAMHTEGTFATTNYGFVYSTTASGNLLTLTGVGVTNTSSIGNPNSSFNKTIINLLSGTTYYIRAYASNQAGTNYSIERNIRTQQPIDFTGITSSGITASGAHITATITNGHPTPTAVGFLYKRIDNSLIDYNKNTTINIASPIILLNSNALNSLGATLTLGATGVKNISGMISGNGFSADPNLFPATPYVVRAYATNNAGTTYSQSIQINTPIIYLQEILTMAPWGNRFNFVSYTYNNKLWIAGGRNNTVSGLNDVWNSVDGINWTQVTTGAAWSGRYHSQSAVYDNKMWIMRGLASNTEGDQQTWTSTDGVNWSFFDNVSSRVYITNSNIPGHQYSSAVVFNGTLWQFGGQELPLSSSGVSERNAVNYAEGDFNYWSLTQGDSEWYPNNNLDNNIIDGFRVKKLFVSAVFKNKIWALGGKRVGEGSAGFETNDIWSSSNGTEWERNENGPWEPGDDYQAIVYKNRLWMIDINSTNVWWSADGINWNNYIIRNGRTNITFDVGIDSYENANFNVEVFNDKLYFIVRTFSDGGAVYVLDLNGVSLD